MGKHWSPLQKEQLRSLFEQGLTYEEIATQFNKSQGSIKFQLAKLKLSKLPAWTIGEVKLLRQLYADLDKNVSEIAARLGKSEGAIHAKARHLGLTRRTLWSEEEIARLEQLAGTMPKGVLVTAYNKWASLHGYRPRCQQVIANKLNNMAISRRLSMEADWYTGADIESFLGCDRATAVKWMNRYEKILRPQIVSNFRSGGLAVSRKRFRDFLIQHPEIVERYRRTVDLIWLIDLLGG